MPRFKANNRMYIQDTEQKLTMMSSLASTNDFFYPLEPA